jgi:cytochrome c biogenesis protein
MTTGPVTLYRSLASVWRTLRSMRMALILLLVVALASVAGSLVPQIGNSPQRVAALYRDHPFLARVYESASLFDVYGSWWFTLAYVLLLVSLASCLIPRSRGLIRGLRHRPQPAPDLDGLRQFAAATVPGRPEEALERARTVFRRRWYRVSRANGDDQGLAAEKGLAREVGSLVFHSAFFLLLIGVVYGKGFGLTGQVTVVEGETFTEAHANYDLPPAEGRFFSEEMHRGFQVRVTDFDVSYRKSGLPRDFVSRVELRDGARLLRTAAIRVNHPLEHEGVKMFQSGYGWAPVVEVRRDGRLLASGPVVFVTDGSQDQRRAWRGVVKLPSLRPQVGLEFRLLPDPGAFVLGAPMLEARNPFLGFTAYRGDLGLTAAQNVFTLDKRELQTWEEGGIGIGRSARLPGGLEISFPELREYTQFRVTRDPGRGIVFGAALLVLAGLIPALYSSRRKLWVRAVPDGEGTLVQLGGVALQRKAAFEDEFESLARELVGVARVAAPR